MLSLPLHPFPTRQEQVLAELDVMATRAEQHRTEQLTVIEHLAAAGGGVAAARVILGVIEDHLAMLRLTRRYLLDGAPAAAPGRWRIVQS